MCVLISNNATLIASNEASLKQAKSASETAKNLMNEIEELKKVGLWWWYIRKMVTESNYRLTLHTSYHNSYPKICVGYGLQCNSQNVEHLAVLISEYDNDVQMNKIHAYLLYHIYPKFRGSIIAMHWICADFSKFTLSRDTSKVVKRFQDHKIVSFNSPSACVLHPLARCCITWV